MNKKQVIVIALCTLGGVAIALLPREGDHKAHENHNHVSFDIKNYIDEAISRRTTKDIASLIDNQIKTNDTVALANVLQVLDSIHEPAIGAYLAENCANKYSSSSLWLKAAYRYFDSFKQATDSSVAKGMQLKAIDSYNKVVELNPENLDAKVDLGVLYTETSNPMQGITLLREVITKNPEHENALYNLGVLSVKSGQTDKAIERFETLVKSHPAREDAQLILGNLYVQANKIELAKSILTKLAAKSKNEEVKNEAKAQLESISHLHNQ